MPPAAQPTGRVAQSNPLPTKGIFPRPFRVFGAPANPRWAREAAPPVNFPPNLNQENNYHKPGHNKVQNSQPISPLAGKNNFSSSFIAHS